MSEPPQKKQKLEEIPRPQWDTKPLLPSGHSDLPHAPPATKYIKWGGRILIAGFGSIGSGTLPLVLKHIDIDPSRVTVLTGPDRKEAAEIAAKRYGINVVVAMLLKDKFRSVLEPLLSEGDYFINLTVDVGSCDMLSFCNEKKVLYLDTVVEPWLGGYVDDSLTPSQRSNYAQREEMLALKKKFGDKAPTAVSTHGANPGLVSHFVKQALMNIAAANGLKVEVPTTKQAWGELAQKLNIKTIHIAERDTQVCADPKKVGEFVNTWSVDGFISEGCQPAELGWGTHEKHFPEDGAHHTFGTDAAIYLNRPGCLTKVRTWTPTEKEFHGFLVTHNESISIADYFTLKDEGGKAVYRPTVHYAYHPCDAAVLSLHEMAGKNYVEQKEKRLIVDEITDGIDELGVLLCGNEKGVYWYGSQLEIHHSRELIEYNSATSLQVTAAVLGGVIWAMENPTCGIVEPDEIDFQRVLQIAGPYVVPVVGEFSDWTPLYKRETLFSEDLDKEDPFQFKNFRVC